MKVVFLNSLYKKVFGKIIIDTHSNGILNTNRMINNGIPDDLLEYINHYIF